MSRIRRRPLLLALGLGACASEGAVPYIAAEELPRYRHLTPLRLDVAHIEFLPLEPARRVAIASPAPINPAEAMLAMGQDRLSAAGREGRATYTVLAAQLTRRSAGQGGLFTPASERLDCALRCRLDIRSAEGDLLGFAEAEVRRTATQPANDPAERARNAETIVREAMADMNVEFEFQIRRALRSLLLETEGAAAPPPLIEREALPRT